MELERDHDSLASKVSERHGQVMEKLGSINEGMARQGERLGGVERATGSVESALTKYIDEQRADKRSIRNIIIGAVAGVLVEGIILVYVLASRAGIS